MTAISKRKRRRAGSTVRHQRRRRRQYAFARRAVSLALALVVLTLFVPHSARGEQRTDVTLQPGACQGWTQAERAQRVELPPTAEVAAFTEKNAAVFRYAPSQAGAIGEATENPDLTCGQFDLSDIPKGSGIAGASVQLSLAAVGSEEGADVLVPSYSLDEGRTWSTGETILVRGAASNAGHEGYWKIPLPDSVTREQLGRLRVRLHLDREESSTTSTAYLDGVALTVVTTKRPGALKRFFRVSEEPIIVVEEKSLQDVELLDADGRVITAPYTTVVEEGRTKIIFRRGLELKPGSYVVRTKSKKFFRTKSEEQRFTFGTLNFNTSKSSYEPGDLVTFAMGVLDDRGRTVCNAPLTLTVTKPNGEVTALTTADRAIVRSAECGAASVTNQPDYSATLLADQVGSYSAALEVQTDRGSERVAQSFDVHTEWRTTVERLGPTRINPKVPYINRLRVTPAQDMKGLFQEAVPVDFSISVPELAATTVSEGGQQLIRWQVDWRAGQTYELEYTFKAPEQSPAVFLLGPSQLGDFVEPRQWSVSSDETVRKEAAGLTFEHVSLAADDFAPARDTLVEPTKRAFRSSENAHVKVFKRGFTLREGKRDSRLKPDATLTVTQVDIDGPSSIEAAALRASEEFTQAGQAIELIHLVPKRSFRPGIYTVRTTLTDGEKTVTEEQSFAWGVLVINTTKSVYHPGETVSFGMGVLNKNGDTVCNASLTLMVTAPAGSQTVLRTSDGGITASPECALTSVTNVPDYAATYQVAGSGTYALELTAVTDAGAYTITDEVRVQDSVTFDITRDAPTRVYPLAEYDLAFTVIPGADFRGTFQEKIPSGYRVVSVGQEGVVAAGQPGEQVIGWDVDWKAGESYQLTYRLDPEDISPALYLLGPASVGSFTELRQWQIASDTTHNLIGFWDGGSAPTGWSCLSCGSGDFYQKFPRGAATYGGTSGAATHTHTVGWVSSSNPNTGPTSDVGTALSARSHTHDSLTSGSTDAQTSLPVYQNLKVIRYDTVGDPATIPQGFIGVFDTTVPSGWTRYSAQDSDFIRGENDATSTGGAANHTHTTSITTGSPSSANGSVGLDVTLAATGTHTHSGNGTTASGDHTPQYIDVILGKADNDTTLPDGMIALWDAAPGTGWDVISGSSEAFDSKFLRGSATYGSTGGATTHTHSNLGIATGAPSATDTVVELVTARNVASDTHTHTITVSHGSTNNLPPYTDAIVAKYNTVDLSGNAYTDEGTTAIDGSSVNKTVNIRVNGAGTYTTEITLATGAWSKTGIPAQSGDIITVYLDNETEEATTVDVSDGTNQTNLHLYQNRTIVRADTGSITNANLSTGDDADDDVKYNVAAGALTVDSGFELHVWTGDTFAPGGTVTTQAANVHIDTSATFNANSNAVSVGGSWTNSGTYTPGTNTTTFTATATGKTINAGASSFSSVTFNGSGGAWSPLTNTLTVTGDLTMIAGTFDTSSGTASVTVNGTVQCSVSCGTINMTSTNTFTQSVTANKNFGTNVAIATDWSFYNFTFTSTSGSPTITINGTGTGEINVTNDLTTSTSGTALTVDNETNDRIFDVDNDVTIGANTTFSASSTAAFSVGGSWANSGTFTPNTGTVTLDSTAATETISSGSSSFYHLTVNNGLVGYWKLDDGTGTSAVDSSGYGATASLIDANSNSVWTTSVNNTTYYGNNPAAFDFNGDADAFNPGNQAQYRGMAKLTVSAWFNPDFTGTSRTIVGNWGANTPIDNRKFLLRYNSTNLQGYIFTNGTGQIGGTFFTGTYTGGWHHVALTWDGSTLRMYLDGSLSGTTYTGTGAIQSTSQDALWIGDDPGASGNPFNGKIDEVRIYTRAISQAEVTSLNSGSHPTVATYTLQSALTVAGNLAVRTGAIDVSTGNCSSAPCSITLNGDYRNVAGFTPQTGTVTFSTAAPVFSLQADQPFYHLTFTGGGGVTLDKQRLDVDGDLTISSGSLDVSISWCSGGVSCGINLAGSFSNSATFTARTGTVTLNGTNTGKTINPGSSSFYNLTFNGSGGAWSPLTNTVTATNDLTITAGTFDTSSGTASVTVNGNVACGASCGTINMTSTNTFTQSVATSKNFGPNVGTTAWTFYNLTHTSSSGTPTITFASTGTGAITVSNNYSTTNSGTSLTVDNDTNDRTFDVSGNVTLGAGTTFSSSASATFTVGGTWANSGTFTANGGTVTFDSTATGKTINAGSSSFSSVTFNGSGGAWSPLTNTLTVTGDLTMIAGTFDTSSGTASVTVNGTVQCSGTCGTINMTSTNTFTQSVTANKNFGTNVAVSTDWTFYNLTFTSTSGSPTITINGTGTGEINVTNDLTTSTSGTALTVDNETNDRIFDVDNDVTIGANTTFSASSTATFSVGGSWANSGTFTPNSGTVTLDSVAATETINNGSSAFNHLTVNNGLVGYWKLDEGTGIDAYDASGYGDTGTYTGSPTFTASTPSATYYGADPGAVTLNGSSQYVDLGNPDQLNTGFTDKITLAAWVKPAGSTAGVIVGKSHSSTHTSPWYKWLLYRTANNCISVRIDTTYKDSNTCALTNGVWGHTAGVYNGSTIQVYINGGDQGNTGKTGNIQTSSQNARIGARHTTSMGEYLNGSVDDVRIYNRALSASEISSLASGVHSTVTTYTLQSALDVDGNLALRTGKLDVSATNCSSAPCAVTVAGNYVNVAGLEPRTGTVTLDGGTTGKTVQADMPFYDFKVNNASGGWTLDKQRLDANNNLEITAGTLDVSASSCYNGTSCGLNVASNWTNAGTLTAQTGIVTFDGTATGKTINPGASSFYNLTFNGSGGAWSPLTNTVTATNDLTMTAGTFDTSSGTANVTVNGNVTCGASCGTINMTATNTFTQSVATSKNFGPNVGTTAWTFNNLTQTASSGTPTITHSGTGTGTITVASTYSTSNSGTSLIVDNDTNDRNLTASNKVTIGAGTTLSASSSGTFNVGENWTNNGTFTSNSGTVTFNGTSQQTFNGTMTGSSSFGNVTITNNSGSDPESSPSVIFAAAATTTGTFTATTANVKVRFNAGSTYTFQNISLNGQATSTRVKFRSSSTGTAWNLNVAGTRSVSSTEVRDSNACGQAPDIDATDGTNFDASGNTCWSIHTMSFSLSDNIIGYGSLSASAARYATGDASGSASEVEAHTLAASSSATNGYAITVQGATLASGGNTITAIGGVNTASSPGSEQFGLRMTASGGSGTVTSPYAASGFAYAADGTTVSQVASAPAASSTTTYSVRYLGNITTTTEAGSYSTSLTYIMTPVY